MRLRLVLAVLAVSLVTVVPSARAQTDIERAREQVAATTERLEEFLDDLEATQRRGDDLAQQYWQVQSGLEKLDADVAASQEIADDLGQQRTGLMNEVRAIAVDQYVHRQLVPGVVDHESEADRAAAETLARLVVGVDNTAIDQLAVIASAHDEARRDLDDRRVEQQQALDDVSATQASLIQELDRLAKLRAALDSELSELEAALGELEEAEAERQAAAAEQARIEEERRRAEEAAARARLVPTPAPTVAVPPTPLPTATAVPVPTPEPTVPNPQPGEPFPTATPVGPEPEPTVPNPQPGQPFPTATPVGPEPEPTVPNPQPSEPFPTSTPVATEVPNPQPSGPVASGGGIVCPLAGPFTHTDDFNSPRAVGGVHRANDLISNSGTPVLAASSGTVEHRNSSVGGLSAHLRGDNGDYYFYTHLSGYENEGAGRVAAGTVIGYVGMTGNAPIPHLHFEIHRGGYGNYTNPYGPVRAACFG